MDQVKQERDIENFWKMKKLLYEKKIYKLIYINSLAVFEIFKRYWIEFINQP